MLLRQNSELRRERIWNWTLPASTVRLADGRVVNCCPAADGCIRLCYALHGTYRFLNVRAAHERNLMMVLDDLPGWEQTMGEELSARRFRPNGEARLPHLLPVLSLDEWASAWAMGGGAAVRIHDAGDFFTDDYTEAWLRLAAAHPDVLFYAYTKEVPRFRALVEDTAPVNFRWLYSLGGKFDGMLDRDRDRHAEVFPDPQTLADAGYVNQSESDLLAVLAPSTRIGIPANNIASVKKRMNGLSFGAIQETRAEIRRSRTRVTP